MEDLNLFDIIVIALVLMLGLKGLIRGLIKELFGLIGIIGGVFVASRLAKSTGDIINNIVPMQNDNTILLIGFIISLILFWIIAYLLGIIISKIFCASGLGIFDRFFGFIFGASKIFLLFAVISYAISQVKIINDNLQPKLKDSLMFPLLVQTGDYILKLDSTNLQQNVSKQLDGIVDEAKETITDLTKEEMEKRAKELKQQLMETKSEK